MKPKIAFISTGGTIASVGRDRLDLLDYAANEQILSAEAILAGIRELNQIADVIPVSFQAVPSSAIGFVEWRALSDICNRLIADHPDISGIVIGHGTATLEETAYALDLICPVDRPIVVVGSQRPFNALSSDAAMNLVAAFRTAAAPVSRGRGVLVVLNDEIHAARDVTKTSVARLQTFRAPDFGALGHVDGDRVRYYRIPERCAGRNAPFDMHGVNTLPRVDISYAHADSDGTAVRAFVAAGARGIVSAGFAPGMTTPQEAEALAQASRAGVIIVQSTRAGSGVVPNTTQLAKSGILSADNLTPQKACILLKFALTRSNLHQDIALIFASY